MNNIVGHKHILDYIRAVIAAGKLHHAYLITGPQHVGKRAVADAVARELTKTTVPLQQHPDIRIIQQEINPKTGKLRKSISIDQVREARSLARSRPLMAPYRVIIIDQAELLSGGAANALLKSLEEPNKQTIFFLVTHRPDLLPQTIISRSQQLYCQRVSDEEIRSDLETQGAAAIADIVRFAHGRPGLARRMAADPLEVEARKKEEERFHSLFGMTFAEKRQVIEPLFGKKEDHVAGRQALGDVLDQWQLALHELLTQRSAEWTTTHLAIYNTIDEVQHELQRNVHPRLLMEHILLQIP